MVKVTQILRQSAWHIPREILLACGRCRQNCHNIAILQGGSQAVTQADVVIVDIDTDKTIRAPVENQFRSDTRILLLHPFNDFGNFNALNHNRLLLIRQRP